MTYFVVFLSYSLRPLDVEFMRRLSKVVNIVPVIAKADTLTLEERDYFKQTVRGLCYMWMCVGVLMTVACFNKYILRIATPRVTTRATERL